MQADALVAEPGQRLRRHHDPEIRAADADVDDVGEARAGEAEDAPLVHSSDELAHPGELGAHLGHHVLPVRQHRPVRPVAQRHVHGGAAFGVVHGLAGEQRRDARGQVAGLGQRLQQVQRFAGDALPREIVEQVERLHAGRIEATGAVGGEQVTQVTARELAQRAPRALSRRTMCCDSRRGAPAVSSPAPQPASSRITPAVSTYRSPVWAHTAVPSPFVPSGNLSPKRLIQPMCRAGTPTISANAGTSRLTTAPARDECVLADLDAADDRAVGAQRCAATYHRIAVLVFARDR